MFSVRCISTFVSHGIRNYKKKHIFFKKHSLILITNRCKWHVIWYMFIFLHTTWYGYLTFPWSKYLVILFTKEFFCVSDIIVFWNASLFETKHSKLLDNWILCQAFLGCCPNTVWNLIFLDKFKTFAVLFQSHFILLPCSLIMTSILLLNFHFWKFSYCKESRVC